ncbi:MAG: hypothetical protein GY930_01435 [bacterium]|nr:hypothetical protein [bacterium]
MRQFSAILALSLIVSCQSPTDGVATAPVAPPVDLSNWATELIQFPPHFAPTMPAGRESLLFSPGWRTEGAEDNWAYALLMELEEPNVGAERIGEILDLYYDGLMGMVARNNKPFTIPEDPSDVTMRSLGDGRFEAQVKTYDSFKDGSPLTLNMLVAAEYPNATTTILRIRACRHEPGNTQVWDQLQQALDSLSFE